MRPATTPTAVEAEPLWTAADVARHLKCARKTVYNMAGAGTLPAIHIGGLLRFDPAKIRALARGEALAPEGAAVLALRR